MKRISKIFLNIMSLLIISLFSLFILTEYNNKEVYADDNYTVDFTYNNKTESIIGNSKNYDLSSVLNNLGIDDEIVDINLYDNSGLLCDNNVGKDVDNSILFDIVKSDNLYYFNSYKSFTINFILEVIGNNKIYNVQITDPISITVTYVGNGGKTIDGQESYSESERRNNQGHLQTNCFNRTGYKFKCWNTIQDGTGYSYEDGADFVFLSDIYLYAIWEKVYTVSYDSNAGEDTVTNMPSDTNEYAGGATVTIDTTTIPQRNGYIFIGWNLNSSETTAGEFSNNQFSISEDTTLYAIWEQVIENDPTESNGYVVTVNDELTGTITYQWFKKVSDNDATQISGATSAAFPTGLTLEDATYYCEVYIDSVKVATSGSFSSVEVVFDGNDETSGDDPSYQYKLFRSDYNVVTLPTTNPYTKNGYTFIGWNSDSNQDSGETSSYTICSDESYDNTITLYAIWQSLEYSEDFEINIIDLSYGKTVSTLSVSIKSVGDNEGTDGILSIDSFELFKESTTSIYDLTSVNSVDKPGVYRVLIGLSLNNDRYFKTVPSSFSTVRYNGYVTYNSNYSYGATACSSYTLSSQTYVTDVDNYLKTKMVVDIRIELSAYTIVYDDNVNDETIEVPTDCESYLDGAPLTLSTTAPTRSGYKFIGWNTDKSATTALESYTINKNDATDNTITLYAIWGHYCNNITFNIPLNSSFTGGALISGNYFLDSDITLSEAITIASDQTVILCLNDKVLNLNKYNIVNNGSLTIYDCGSTNRYFTDEVNVVYDSSNNSYTTVSGSDGCYETYIGNTSETSNALSITGGVIFNGWGSKESDLKNSRGGAIKNYGSLVIKSGNVVGNLSNEGTIISNGSFTLDGGTIAGNRSSNLGYISNNLYYCGCGAVSIDSNSTFVMNAGEICYNTANYGAAINNLGNVTINGGSINHNYAIECEIDNNYGKRGGAIYNKGTLVINNENVTISYNTATYGAAIFSGGNLTIEDGTFTNNTAITSAGAVYNCGTLTINNVTLSNNTATYGGAIYNHNATLIFNNGTLSNNTACYGGGFYNYIYNNNGTYNGSLTINGGTFSYNTASNGNDWSAGGVFYNESGSITINNNATFTHNSAGTSGGVVYNEDILTINGGTFSYNTAAYGSVIYNFEGTFTMNDGEMSSNTVTEWGTIVADGPTYLLGGSIINNTLTNTTEGKVYGADYGAAGVDLFTNEYLTIGGSIVIKDNKTNGVQDNLLIENSSSTITFNISNDYPLTDDSYISIGLLANTGTFVSSYKNSTDLKYFHLDNSTYGIIAREVKDSDPLAYNYNIETLYTITYDSNGATSGTVPSDTNKYYNGDNITISSNTGSLTKDGYKFIGWNTDSSAITALGSYSIDEDDADENNVITLYAVWGDLEYTSDISLSITELGFGKKNSDITVSVNNSDLTLVGYSIGEVNGNYDNSKGILIYSTGYYVEIVLKCTTDGAWFDNTKAFSNEYDHNVTAPNYDCHAFGVSSYTLGENYNPTGISSTDNIYLFVKAYIDLSGYQILYDENVEEDENVNDMPENSGIYLVGAPVEIDATIPTRYNYKFVGWNTDEDAKTALTFTDNKITMTDGNITLYAIWTKIISNEPNKSNDYEVIVDSSINNVSYQWYKNTESLKSITDCEMFDLSEDNGTTCDFVVNYGAYNNGTLTFEEDSQMYVLLVMFSNGCSGATKVKFKYSGEEDIYLYTGITGSDILEEALDGYYYIDLISMDGDAVFALKSGKEITITDIYVIGTISTKIDSETNAKLSSISNDSASYFCEVRANSLYATSETITPNKVSFNINCSDTITTPSDIYQLEGRSITLPTITRTGYNLDGWNTLNNATQGLTTYTVGSTDITLYAVWKLNVSITEAAQTAVYNGSSTSFEIKGAHKDIGSFVIKYASHKDTHTDNDWSLVAPTNAGSYDVLITRAEDDTYSSYEKTITNGLTINNKSLDNTTESTAEEVVTNKVEVSTDNGFDPTITLKVEVTEEKNVAETLLSILKSLVSNTISSLKSNERVGVVYDIKLIQVNGDNEEEVQPGENETVKVKIQIPNDVDINKVTRILHIHSNDEIEEIEFDKSKVDSDRFFEFEVGSFSSFAFIYEVDESSTLPWWAILLIVLGSLLLIFIVLFVLWKIEYDKTIKLENDLNSRKLKIFDVVFIPINELLNKLIGLIFKKKQTE